MEIQAFARVRHSSSVKFRPLDGLETGACLESEGANEAVGEGADPRAAKLAGTEEDTSEMAGEAWETSCSSISQDLAGLRSAAINAEIWSNCCMSLASF